MSVCVEGRKGVCDDCFLEAAYLSSPGIERELTRDFHFTRYLGSRVIVKFIRPVNGKRVYKCTLKDYDAGLITVEFDEGGGMSFEKKEASFVKLDDFDM